MYSTTNSNQKMQQPAGVRSMVDIQNALAHLDEYIWYNRYLAQRAKMHPEGSIVNPGVFLSDMERARQIKEKYGDAHSGICDDEEWGAANGLRTALLWILGGSWDTQKTSRGRTNGLG